MPFFKQIQNEHGTLSIWKLAESSEELLSSLHLPENDRKRLAKITSEKRECEFLSTRMLLQRSFETIPEICYNQWGKPFFANRKENISISHSADFATIFCSNQKIGIDIEVQDRNIERVCKRFLHPEEMAFINTLPNQQLAKIVYWCAKEAIFKCSEIHGIQFNEQIRINPFNPENGTSFTASLSKKGQTTKYQLHTHFIENNVLVYCVEL